MDLPGSDRGLVVRELLAGRGAGRAADEHILDLFAAGDHRRVIEEMPEYKKQGPEGKFGHYLIMAGALGGAACTAPGEQFSDYEAAVGTGQVHVWFERPAGGWAA